MKADVKLDCYGLLCPMPIIRTADEIMHMKVGQVLEVTATDIGIKSDMQAWCRTAGHQYLGMEENDGEYTVYVKKMHD